MRLWRIFMDSSPNEIDLENVISDEIRKRMQRHIGTRATEDSCQKIKDSILEYLTEINTKMRFCNVPVVQVENEGPFVTINFFNHEGVRLETLGDMLLFMEGQC